MIDKEKLLALLHILEPFNNGDIPKWAWDVIKDFREEQDGQEPKKQGSEC